MSMKIDDEFKALIYPLTDAEKQMLEQSILSEGCRDPLIVWNGILLDGHHRLEICNRHGIGFETKEIELEDRTDAEIWIIRNQLARRNLNKYQYVTLTLKLEPMIAAKAKEKLKTHTKQGYQKSDKAVHTNKELAKIADVSHDTVYKVKKIDEKATDKEKEALIKGEKSINAVYKKINRDEKSEKRKKEKLESKNSFLLKPELICKDIKEITEKDVQYNSLDWIITDPPYPKKYLSLYQDLSMFGMKYLKPGGSLICMSGQSYLPEVIKKLNMYLDWHWCCAYLTIGDATQIYHRKIATNWKPLLWFTKGKRKGPFMKDLFQSMNREKEFDEWGQSESGMKDIIEKLTYSGELICDPFMGTGTTGYIALSLKRNFIGIEIDEQKYIDAKKRLE